MKHVFFNSFEIIPILQTSQPPLKAKMQLAFVKELVLSTGDQVEIIATISSNQLANVVDVQHFPSSRLRPGL